MKQRRSSRRGRERGVVSAELALSTLVVIIVLAMATWGMALVMVQLACLDTVSAVARQAARGDRAGLAAAEAAAPPGSRFEVRRRGDQVEVRIATRVDPPGALVPTVTLRARARAVLEPGAG